MAARLSCLAATGAARQLLAALDAGALGADVAFGAFFASSAIFFVISAMRHCTRL